MHIPDIYIQAQLTRYGKEHETLSKMLHDLEEPILRMDFRISDLHKGLEGSPLSLGKWENPLMFLSFETLSNIERDIHRAVLRSP